MEGRMELDSTMELVLWTIEKRAFCAPPGDAGCEYVLDAAAWKPKLIDIPFQTRRRIRRERRRAMALRATAAVAAL